MLLSHDLRFVEVVLEVIDDLLELLRLEVDLGHLDDLRVVDLPLLRKLVPVLLRIRDTSLPGSTAASFSSCA